MKRLSFILILALSVPAWAGLCEEEFIRLAEPALQELLFESQFHTCGECFANSGEMGRELLTRSKEEGTPMDERDLEIVILFNRRIKDYEAEDEFRLKDGIFHSDHHDGTEEEPIPFKYHAVLVHKGMVLDMDLRSQVVLPWDEYVSLAFPPRVADELADSHGTLFDVEVNMPYSLRATRIPFESYRLLYPEERPSHTYDLESEFLFDRDSEPADAVDFEE